VSELRHKALSVGCPVCKAPRGVDCDAPHKPGGQHVQRTTRGVRTAWRGDAAQHERAVAALERVGVAARRGAAIDDHDVVTAIACGGPCGECGGIENLLRIGVELHRLGALPELAGEATR